MINGGGRKQQNHSNNDGFSGFKVFGGASDVLFFSYYVVIVAIGVAMNSFVIYTMRRLKRRDREQVCFLYSLFA
jgi:hypothetical protein